MLDDAIALMAIIRKHAPAPLICDVMHDAKQIVLRVFDGQTPIFERRLAAKKAR